MMNTMMQVYNPMEAPPDVLPDGSCTQFEVTDAGAVWNKEMGIEWTKPGEFIQYTLTSSLLEIRIMRIATFPNEIEYCVVFGPIDDDTKMGERLSLDELKAVIRGYLSGGCNVE